MRSTSASCARAREWVSRRLDAELSQFEDALLDAHLASCADCSVYEADVTAITRELREAPREPLERPITLPSYRRLAPRFVQVSAAALALAAVGLGSVFTSLQAQHSFSGRDGRSDARTAHRQPPPLGFVETEEQWLKWRGAARRGSETGTRSRARAGSIQI